MAAIVRCGLVAIATATFGLAITVPPAAAEEPAALGWWWAGRPSTTFPAVLSPVPAVPDGGLYVSGNAHGPSGLSALRFEFDRDFTPSTLTLEITESIGAPVISVCPTERRWKPAENGAWDQRPATDCEAASVAGVVDLNKGVVTFEVRSLAESGVVDVVLVPGVDSQAQRRATFSVAFEPPRADTLLVDRSADIVDGSADTPASATPATAGAPSAEGLRDATAGPAFPDTTDGGAPEATSHADSGVDSTPAMRRRPFSVAGAAGFAYAAVLALPLVLLTGGSYLAWALSRPVVVAGIAMPLDREAR